MPHTAPPYIEKVIAREYIVHPCRLFRKGQGTGIGYSGFYEADFSLNIIYPFQKNVNSCFDIRQDLT